MLLLNINVHVYILEISLGIQWTVQLYPWYWNTLCLWSHLLWGEFRIFSAAVVNHYNSASFFHTMYLSLLCGYRQHGMRSLPDIFGHNQHWKSNPRPFNLESNARSTQPHSNMWFIRAVSASVQITVLTTWTETHKVPYVYTKAHCFGQWKGKTSTGWSFLKSIRVIRSIQQLQRKS